MLVMVTSKQYEGQFTFSASFLSFGTEELTTLVAFDFGSGLGDIARLSDGRTFFRTQRLPVEETKRASQRDMLNANYDCISH
jgi:hypothetical protein